MLIDRYGKEVYPGEWFIRMDQNNEGRVYLVEGYPKEGYVAVHEHKPIYDTVSMLVILELIPARLKQTIKLPSGVLWYPKVLLPKVGAREQ